MASAPPGSSPPGSAPPSVPAPVLTTAGDGQITVSWGTPLNDGGAPIQSFTVTGSGGAEQRHLRHRVPRPGDPAHLHRPHQRHQLQLHGHRHQQPGIDERVGLGHTCRAAPPAGGPDHHRRRQHRGQVPRRRRHARRILGGVAGHARRPRPDADRQRRLHPGPAGRRRSGEVLAALGLRVGRPQQRPGLPHPRRCRGGHRDGERAGPAEGRPGHRHAPSAGIFNGTPYGVQVQACTRLTEAACTDDKWSAPSSMGFREHTGSSLGTDPRVTDLLDRPARAARERPAAHELPRPRRPLGSARRPDRPQHHRGPRSCRRVPLGAQGGAGEPGRRHHRLPARHHAGLQPARPHGHASTIAGPPWCRPPRP